VRLLSGFRYPFPASELVPSGTWFRIIGHDSEDKHGIHHTHLAQYLFSVCIMLALCTLVLPYDVQLGPCASGFAILQQWVALWYCRMMYKWVPEHQVCHVAAMVVLPTVAHDQYLIFGFCSVTGFGSATHNQYLMFGFDMLQLWRNHQ
jgi:hypothetical protein